jgi:hypothetical protein
MQRKVLIMATESRLTFAYNPETNGVEWYVPKDAPDVTTEQAMVIAVAQLGAGLSEIASGLHAVADAIRDIER